MNDPQDGDVVGDVENLDGERRRAVLHLWGGRYNLLPKDWVFPKGLNLKAMFHLWFLGQRSQDVPPLGAADVSHITRGRKVLRDMQYLINHARRALQQTNKAEVWCEDIWDWDVRKVNRMYRAVLDRFMIGNHNRNIEGLFWSRIVRK